MQFNQASEGCVSTGNVWGDAQFSNFIRAFNETECNGFTNAPGQLQAFDLGLFRGSSIPFQIRAAIRNRPDSRHTLYRFDGGKAPGYFGWLLTDSRGTAVIEAEGPARKSHGVLDVVVPAITGTEADDVIRQAQARERGYLFISRDGEKSYLRVDRALRTVLHLALMTVDVPQDMTDELTAYLDAYCEMLVDDLDHCSMAFPGEPIVGRLEVGSRMQEVLKTCLLAAKTGTPGHALPAVEYVETMLVANWRHFAIDAMKASA